MRGDKPEIIVDTRESSFIKKILVELGCGVIEKTITPADYVLSEDWAVERKRFRDFLKSVFDGRLFEQAERLADAYTQPILLVEGDITTELSMTSNPKVFWGALAKVTADHELSIIFTPNKSHTATFLHSLAKKLQTKKEEKQVFAKYKPRAYTLKQKQLMAVQSLPNIGAERAERLLEKFRTVRKVFQAPDRELVSIEGLGKKTIQQIRQLLDTKYPGLEM